MGLGGFLGELTQQCDRRAFRFMGGENLCTPSRTRVAATGGQWTECKMHTTLGTTPESPSCFPGLCYFRFLWQVTLGLTLFIYKMGKMIRPTFIRLVLNIINKK